VGDKARIVSRNGSNRVAIRAPSCDSTSMRFVNVGLVVTLGKRSLSGDGILIRAKDGSLLGCILQEKLEPVGPAEE
jgi:hypothetical protein